MRRLTARERRAKLDAIGKGRTQRVPAVHRRAVLAGAPTRTADPRRLPPRLRRKGHAVTQEYVAQEAKRAGTSRYTMMHPGAAGHERCRDICITYG